MRFIEFTHPEGRRFLANIDHITSVHYRPGEGDVKSRLGLDLDQRQNDIVIFGDEAERTWELLKRATEN